MRWGAPVVEVASDGATLTIVPERGGKIVSLRDREGVEWLAQPVDPLPAPARPGAEFTSSEMCGWDECAPSIDQCVLDDVAIPDHGDLWTAPWWSDGDECGAVGPSWGYRFTRKAERAPGGFLLRYRVHLPAERRAMPFLWAAHPQFAAPPGTRVEVDAGSHVWDVLADPPVSRAWDDDLASIDTLEDGECRKVYLDPERAVSSTTLCRADGSRLNLTWDAAVVPYLGLWFDAGAYSRDRVIALEPSTGYCDDLSRAHAATRVPLIRPGESLSWDLRVELVTSASG